MQGNKSKGMHELFAFKKNKNNKKKTRKTTRKHDIIIKQW